MITLRFLYDRKVLELSYQIINHSVVHYLIFKVTIYGNPHSTFLQNMVQFMCEWTDTIRRERHC